jgi:hypothetical protein
MVLFRISLASATLAHAWNWEAGKNANSQDKRRVSSRIRQEVGLLREKEGGQNEWRAEAARLGNQLDVICDWIQQSVLSLGRPLHSSSVDVIMRPSGNEDWCHRLIDQRTGGRLLFRPALLPEEHDCLEMARFLARGARENNYGE